ncbi:hypothetical protein [Janibacter sp. G1551]|uniref:hypothetical protein n=1 Tax=Janibacter sp. G1551 TaxID=3420440 RepID=UPI003D007448
MIAEAQRVGYSHNGNTTWRVRFTDDRAAVLTQVDSSVGYTIGAQAWWGIPISYALNADGRLCDLALERGAR